MRKTFFLIIILCTGLRGRAQDTTLLSMLNDSLQVSASDPVSATFKATHIVNMQTVESPAKNDLNFIIQHRFGRINEGAYNFFGLDNATLRLGLDYGINNRLAVGVGRSSFNKTFDGYLKYKLIRQTVSGNIPVSVSVIGTITYNTFRDRDKPYLNAKLRTTYMVELPVARKFSNRLSLQLTPTWLHFNLVPTPSDKNDVFAAAVGGRYKFTKRMGITAEYNYVLPNQINSLNEKNSLSCGVDIETGGHVFQLVFSNSGTMIGPQYIARTEGSWGKGDIYFGFNISRNFSLGKNHKSFSR